MQQSWCDLAPGNFDGAFDDSFVLLARQTGDQEFALIDTFGQSFELTAFSDEVGPHCQHDIDRDFFLRGGFQQQTDKLVGCFLLPLARFVEAEDFFELVDDNQEIGPFAEIRLLDRFDQAEMAAAESGEQIFSRIFLVAIVKVRIQQRFGQQT